MYSFYNYTQYRAVIAVGAGAYARVHAATHRVGRHEDGGGGDGVEQHGEAGSLHCSHKRCAVVGRRNLQVEQQRQRFSRQGSNI